MSRRVYLRVKGKHGTGIAGRPKQCVDAVSVNSKYGWS